MIETATTPTPSFWDLFYNGLFHPVGEYRRIAVQKPFPNALLFYGLIFVLLVSVSAPVVHLVWQGGDIEDLVMAIPLRAVSGLLVWMAIAGVISLLAYALMGEGRFRTFLALSSLSTLPWVLMGPLSLLKVGLGDFGSVVGVAAGLIIWMWSVFLFALAIGITYTLSVERVLIVLVMPFVFTAVALFWILSFFINIAHLIP